MHRGLSALGKVICEKRAEIEQQAFFLLFFKNQEQLGVGCQELQAATLLTMFYSIMNWWLQAPGEISRYNEEAKSMEDLFLFLLQDQTFVSSYWCKHTEMY